MLSKGSLALFDRSNHGARWSLLSFIAVALLVLSLGAACGNEDDDDDTGASAATAATDAGNTAATVASDAGSTAVSAASSGELGAIGMCFMSGTTSGIVEDLRAGNTDSAEEMYRGCLGDALPEGLVSQLDPIIEQAATCGTTAAEGLSDEEVASIEQGDEAVAERVSTETLQCVSDELGIDLS
jgi:hypothetical protein